MADREFKKVIRDPIYGYIGVTEQELKVIELPVFQRLRRISQLSFADMVYPNATHNRFSHSLGVMHLARIFSDYLKTSGLGKRLKLSPIDYQAIIWAGLLHDIGHLPFSHVCEPIFAYYFPFKDSSGWRDYHVRIGAKIISNSSFKIKDILGEEVVGKVCALIKGDESRIPRLLVEGMTGICSVDRLDYLRRDAYHAGTPEYAIIDQYRILTSHSWYQQDPGWAPIFTRKALYALEGAILSYFYMYKAIYYHHAVRAAYLLFQNIIWDAFKNYGLKGRVGNFLAPPTWIHFDDHFFLACLRDSYKKVPIRLKQLIFRKLPKMISGIEANNNTRIYRFIETSSFNEKVEKEEALRNRLKKYNIERILLDSPMVIPYPRSLLAEKAIFIWDGNEEPPQNIGEVAPYILNLHDAAERQLAARVYVSPAELRFNDEFIRDLNIAIMEELQ